MVSSAEFGELRRARYVGLDENSKSVKIRNYKENKRVFAQQGQFAFKYLFVCVLRYLG